MTKSELITKLTSKQAYLPNKDIELVVNCLINTMSNALVSGERIEIRGFGSFSSRRRPPRIARNPRTGAAVSLSQKHSIRFKAGLELSKRVRESADTYLIHE